MSFRVAILITGRSRVVLEVEARAVGAMDDATGAAIMAAELRKQSCVVRVRHEGVRVLAEVEPVPF